MSNKIFQWLPHAIIITAFCGLVYLAVQQNYRLTANDPQIQVSEDMAMGLSQGASPDSLNSAQKVDISKSLALFFIVYNDQGQGVVASGYLDGQVPQIPSGVLAYAKAHGQNKITWQPKPGVRIAAVVTRANNGYVLVGKSLREVEKRENLLMYQVLAVWMLTMLLTFFVPMLPIIRVVKEKHTIHHEPPQL